MFIIVDKSYMFRPTVAIIRFYPKLYAGKKVYTMCAAACRHAAAHIV